MRILAEVVGTILIVLIMLAVVLLVVSVVCAAVLGVAWVLSKFFPITVSQAALVVIGSVATFLIYLELNGIKNSLSAIQQTLSEATGEGEEEEEEEEELEADESLKKYIKEISKRSPIYSFPKLKPFRKPQPEARPNDPCPCGSGRKHKRCCGKP